MIIYGKNLAFVFFLVAISGCRADPSSPNMKAPQTYRVTIPNFVLELNIPAEAKLGYAQFKKEVLFETPPNPRYTVVLGDGIYRKDVGGFYVGARNDFSDWDLTLQIFVIKCDSSKRLIRSADDLVELGRALLGEDYILADGTKVNDLGEITVERIGLRDVIIASRADPYRYRTIRVRNTSGAYTGQTLSKSPYQLYFTRLDDEVAIGIQVFHENERKLDLNWYATSHARIARILKTMKVGPINRGPQKVSG